MKKDLEKENKKLRKALSLTQEYFNTTGKEMKHPNQAIAKKLQKKMRKIGYDI